MKKLLLILLCLPFLFSSCKKEEGCTDTAAINYNADAESDDGSCQFSLIGDIWIVNYIEKSILSDFGDTLSFSSGPPGFGDFASLHFTNNNLYTTTNGFPTDTNDWYINVDSLFIESEVFKFMVTKNELELKRSFVDSTVSLISPKDITINATR